MRTEYHHGMKHEVSIAQFVAEFRLRRAKAVITHAKLSARKMARVTKMQIAERIVDFNTGTSDVMLCGLAKQYGVPKSLTTLAVTMARQLISA